MGSFDYLKKSFQQGQKLAQLRTAAKGGDAEAQYALGIKLRDGDGVESDVAESVSWFLEAATQGHVKACEQLGYFCYGQKQYSEALKWFFSASNAGDVNSTYCAGHILTNVTENPEAGLPYLVKAAEAGHLQAMFNAGYCYWKGFGCERNLPEALKWMQIAAGMGHEDFSSLRSSK